MSRTKSLEGRAPTAAVCLLLAAGLAFVYVSAGGARDEGGARPAPSASESEGWNVYDPDAGHVWNRLHRSLHLRAARDGREYGRDELDPLLWPSTRHLLGGPSNLQATKALDEFLDARAERLIADPLKRAVLQRDLWAVFDWAARQTDNATPELRGLRSRLAKAIRRLAPTPKQAAALPDTYERAVASREFAAEHDSLRPDAPFLPADLFRPDGAWAPLGVAGGASTVAPSHVFAADGRSVFRVFISLPQGRAATLAYVKSVAEFQKPWVRDRRRPGEPLPNPRLPQFPAGTRLALVRRMLVVDENGEPTPTAITESVQIRIHRDIPDDIPESFNLGGGGPRSSLLTYEFRLSRARLFAGRAGGLRAVARDERGLSVFQSHGVDHFETEGLAGHGPVESHLRPVLGSCVQCHFRPGIHSVLSRVPDIVELRARDVRRDLRAEADPAREAELTKAWKIKRESWRLLRELWE